MNHHHLSRRQLLAGVATVAGSVAPVPSDGTATVGDTADAAAQQLSFMNIDILSSEKSVFLPIGVNTVG